MILLDYKDARPIYEQITERFKLLILKGVLGQDEQMPSVRSLAMELSINPNTIQKAYTELERQGYIYTVKGRGSFVSDSSHLLEENREAIRLRFRQLYKEGRELGLTEQDFLKYLKEMEG